MIQEHIKLNSFLQFIWRFQMKNALFFGLFLFVATTIVVTQEIEVYERRLTPAEETARNNPGKEVPINLSETEIIRTDFFHYKEMQEYSEVIVFNDSFQTIKKQGVVYSEEKFAKHILQLLIAVILMTISNIYYVRAKEFSDAFFVVFILAVIIALLIVINAVSFTTVPTLAAAAAVVAAILLVVDIAILLVAAIRLAAVVPNSRKETIKYIILVIIFYICAIIALFIDFSF